MPRRRSLLLLTTLFAAALATARCGGDSGDERPDATSPAVDATPASAADGTAAACGAGEIPGPLGGCVAVGVPACAERFVGSDGVCRPRLADCPPGSIPKFDEGCVPVGIQGCAEVFRAADGLCRPRSDACPPGTIPKFDEGCVPVGVPVCAAEFAGEDGFCHPSLDGCPPDAFPVPSEGCVALGGAERCGGAWGGLPDGPDTLYVHPVSGQDAAPGTRAAPLRTIAEAVARAPSGGRVVLGAGTYDEPVELTRDLEVVGICAPLVTVQGGQDTPSGRAIVWAHGPVTASVRDVRLFGGGIGVLASGGATVAVEGVHVERARGDGVRAEGEDTAVRVRGCLVEQTLPSQSAAYGVRALSGATVDVQRSALCAHRTSGARARGAGSTVSLHDTTVEGTWTIWAGCSAGYGALASDRGAVILSGVVVRGHRTVGVGAIGPGSRATVTDSQLGPAPPPGEVRCGMGGALAVDGGHLTADRSAVLGCQGWGLGGSGAGTRLDVTAALVRGTESVAFPGNLLSGGGLWAESGASANIRDAAFVANRVVGVGATGPASRVELAASLVEGTLPEPRAGSLGNGLLIALGAQGILTGCAIVANREAGVLANLAGAELTAEHNLVAGTLTREGARDFGFGVSVQDGAVAVLRHNAVVSNTEIGVYVTGAGARLASVGDLVQDTRSALGAWHGVGFLVGLGARAELADDVAAHNEAGGLHVAGGELLADGVLVEGLAAERTGGGEGVRVLMGGRARVTRLVVGGARAAGLLAAGGGARLEVERSLVEDTVPASESGQLGFGAGAYLGADLALDRCLVRRSHVAGIWISGAQATVRDSLVAETAEGSYATPGGEPRVGVGDGLLATAGAALAVQGTVLRDSARAGLLFDDSSGRLGGSESTGNAYGLVVQGQVRPERADDNHIHGNHVQDILDVGYLEVPVRLAAVPGCVPQCGLRACGLDPACGVSCGACAEGEVCSPHGSCCRPACDGRRCGDDGCGGACPPGCTDGQVCDDAGGDCVACVPLCDGRECGLDPRCGTPCGSCGDGMICVHGRCDACEPDCAGRTCGPDPRCGVPCGPGCGRDAVCTAEGACSTVAFGHTLRLDRLELATEPAGCLDLDGDGAPDNAFAGLWELMASPLVGIDVNAYLTGMLASGSYSFLLDLDGVADAGDTPSFPLDVLEGSWAPEVGWLVEAISFDEQGAPRNRFPDARIAVGQLTAGPGPLLVTVSSFGLILETTDALRIHARVELGPDGVRLVDGLIGGAVSRDALVAGLEDVRRSCVERPDRFPAAACAFLGLVCRPTCDPGTLDAFLAFDQDGGQASSACLRFSAVPTRIAGVRAVPPEE
jgi:hypothetical protein